MDNKVKLTVRNALAWGWRDVEILEEKWLTALDKFGVYIEDIADIIEPCDLHDINTWFDTAIRMLFQEICEAVKDEAPELERKCEELYNDFEPFINALDSWFDNIFDQIDLRSTREGIVEQAINLLRE